MKKYLYALMIILTPNILNAQLKSISPAGGGTVSDFDYTEQPLPAGSFEDENKVGGNGGIKLDIDLGREWLSVAPELFFTQNGAKEIFYTNIDSLGDDLINRKISLNYLGIYLPIRIKLMNEIDMGNQMNPYRGTATNGIYLEVSLFADYALNANFQDQFGNQETDDEVMFASSGDQFDFGCSAFIGFVMQNFKLELGYNYGIKNIEFFNEITPDENLTYIVNNRGVMVRVGYVTNLQ